MGNRRTTRARLVTKTHAREVAEELARKYAAGGIEALDAENMKFSDLAERYKKAKVIDPIFDGEIKVAGMQSKESAEKEVNALLKYWVAWPIQKITHCAIETYKIERLKAPVVWRWKTKDGQVHERQRDDPRKMSSVNHELRRLKAMLNFARRQGWITINPFGQGEPLISEAAEVARNRAEKSEEFQKLLDVCTGRRRYLRAIILTMTDTALRLSEVKRLTRSQLDFDAKVARVRARNTKGNKPREAPFSDRLIEELKIWCGWAASDDEPILPQGEHKKAWQGAKADAGISDDLQLRDLRGWGTGRSPGDREGKIALAVRHENHRPQAGKNLPAVSQDR